VHLMRVVAGFAGVSLLCSAAFVAEPIPRTPSFEERVAAQKAVEQVYWNHRIWPEANPQPKPTLSSVMNDDAIRARVEDYLMKSNAIETWWHRSITSKDLQAELDRMTRETRAPEMLSELYAALGNDPGLIAETLARPTLVDRLIRDLYSGDARFHGATRRIAEGALLSAPGVDAMKTLGGRFERRILRSENRQLAPAALRDAVVAMSAEEWEIWTEGLGRQFGSGRGPVPIRQLSALQEDSERFYVTAVLSLEADAAVVASVAWPKRTFDAWWSAERAATSAEIAPEVANYVIAAPVLSGCTNDTWENRGAFPSGRSGHTAVWTGR
jgi:hypothetical protein